MQAGADAREAAQPGQRVLLLPQPPPLLPAAGCPLPAGRRSCPHLLARHQTTCAPAGSHRPVGALAAGAVGGPARRLHRRLGGVHRLRHRALRLLGCAHAARCWIIGCPTGGAAVAGRCWHVLQAWQAPGEQGARPAARAGRQPRLPPCLVHPAGKLPFEDAPTDDRRLADLHLALYNDCVVFDHATKLAYVIAWVRCSGACGPRAPLRAAAAADGSCSLHLAQPASHAPPQSDIRRRTWASTAAWRRRTLPAALTQWPASALSRHIEVQVHLGEHGSVEEAYLAGKRRLAATAAKIANQNAPQVGRAAAEAWWAPAVGRSQADRRWRAAAWLVWGWTRSGGLRLDASGAARARRCPAPRRQPHLLAAAILACPPAPPRAPAAAQRQGQPEPEPAAAHRHLEHDQGGVSGGGGQDQGVHPGGSLLSVGSAEASCDTALDGGCRWLVGSAAVGTTKEFIQVGAVFCLV